MGRKPKSKQTTARNKRRPEGRETGGRTPVNARRPRTMGRFVVGRFVVGRSADRGRNHAVTDIMLSLTGTSVGAFSLPGSWYLPVGGAVAGGAIGWKAPRTDQAERTPR